MSSFSISIDPDLRRAKTQQIVDCVVRGIASGKLAHGDKLPSINDLSNQTGLGLATVVRAYNLLKERGIIVSAHGKGFYISSTRIRQRLKVFLLFDEFSANKEMLYNGFKQRMGEEAIIDLYFHHYNPRLFESLVAESVGEYTHYVIMPFRDPAVPEIIGRLPQDRVLILDIPWRGVEQRYPSICQDFRKGVIEALDSGLPRITRYQRMIFVIAGHIRNPREVVTGFRQFCRMRGIKGAVAENASQIRIIRGDLFLVVEDTDLVLLIREAQARNLRIGRDVGIISYNENPLKEVIEGGLTVISTDFQQMGRRAAEHLLEGRSTREISPTILTIRKSL